MPCTPPNKPKPWSSMHRVMVARRPNTSCAIHVPRQQSSSPKFEHQRGACRTSRSTMSPTCRTSRRVMAPYLFLSLEALVLTGQRLQRGLLLSSDALEMLGELGWDQALVFGWNIIKVLRNFWNWSTEGDTGQGGDEEDLMIRATFLIAALACVALASPIPEVPENFEDIPAEYKGLIPAEVAEHLKSITPEEKNILKEVAKGYKDFKHEDDFLNALKEKSPALHEKAAKLHTMIKSKVDALNDEAKAFVKKAIADGRKIHAQYLSGDKPKLDQLKATAKTHLDAYKALSQDAKDSIAKEFPILTGFFKNDKVKGLVEKYIN